MVEPEELDAAIKGLPLELVAGLQVAIANVAEVAQAGVDESRTVKLPQGQSVTLREVPVGAAAVYVPGGRAPYPSTVVMGVVTARAAGVLDVVVCSPPGADGEIDRTILGTCRLCGVERVYRIGGAQAIAALAYGTETVGRVEVVVGPGNLYVQEAKRQLGATVGIDGFAGPSDLVTVLGAQAGERGVELAALDLLAQAEHGAGSLVVAIATSADTLDTLAGVLERLVVTRPTVGDAACALVEVAGRAGGGGAGERARARAPGADRRRRGGARPDRALGRCAVRGCGECDRVRRLRGGLQPRAADGRRGALCLGAVGAGTSAGECRKCESARTRWAGWRRRVPRSRARRGSRCTRSRWRRACARMRSNESHSHDRAEDRRDRCAS